MEIQIKKTVKAGNSSAVILPRAWLNREVRIELIERYPEKILSDVLEILKEHIELCKVVGIYLVGSYARGEENEDSDIDLLVITEGIDKNVEEGIYSLTLISTELLNKKLEKDILPIGQMILEARPLLNEYYLKSIIVKITKKNASPYITSTKEKISLIKKVLKNIRGDSIDDQVIYTLVLRLRTIGIIESLSKHKIYSKKDLLFEINSALGKNFSKDVYEAYLVIKNNQKRKGKAVNINHALLLLKYLEKKFEIVKNKVK